MLCNVVVTDHLLCATTHAEHFAHHQPSVGAFPPSVEKHPPRPSGRQRSLPGPSSLGSSRAKALRSAAGPCVGTVVSTPVQRAGMSAITVCCPVPTVPSAWKWPPCYNRSTFEEMSMSDCACVLPRAERGDLRTIRGRPERRWRPSTSSIGSASPWEACPEVGWQTAQMGPRGGDGPSHPAALAPRPSPAGPIRLQLSGHQGAPSSTAHLSRKGLLPLQPFGHPPLLRLHSTHNLDCRREKRNGKMLVGKEEASWNRTRDVECHPSHPQGLPLASRGADPHTADARLGCLI